MALWHNINIEKEPLLPLRAHYIVKDSNADSGVTGKSVSEALILESVNPQYDDRLFMKLRVQYEKK